jgi:hypothetical protein
MLDDGSSFKSDFNDFMVDNDILLNSLVLYSWLNGQYYMVRLKIKRR